MQNQQSQRKPADRRVQVGKVGIVKLERRELNGRLYLKAYDFRRKRYVRKSTGTKSMEKARALALAWKRQIETDRPKAFCTKPERVTIEKALAEGIKLGGRKNYRRVEDHASNLNDYREYFLEWARSNKLHYWDEVDGRSVAEYIEFQQGRGLKPRTLRNYVSVLSIAAKYWAEAEPELYRPLIISHPALALEKPEKHHLNRSQLMVCIATAQKQGNNVFGTIGLVLGGLAGLRIREMLDIRRADYDPKNRTLRITHEKNRYSPRTIPLLPYVADCIAAAFASHSEDLLIHRLDGTHGTDGTVTKPMRRAVVGAGFTIAPKDSGRKTFMNWAKVRGVDADALDAYTGHAPKSTADRFYRRYTVAMFRELVLEPIEAALKAEEQTSARGSDATDAAVSSANSCPTGAKTGASGQPVYL